MFKAEYFSYDGIFSGQYGLRIAVFNAENLESTDGLAPELHTVRAVRGPRFISYGATYETPPEFEFSVVADTPISADAKRDIISWLEPDGKFKDLVIYQNRFMDYTYKCVVSALDFTYHAGNCVGFTGTLQFDSWYAYGPSVTVSVTGSGTAQSVEIINRSDFKNQYVYPKVAFTPRTLLSNGNAVEITNTTDNANRTFAFGSLSLNYEYDVDNELKIITSVTGNDKLSYFNKNWLRLLKGKNTLSVAINGTVTIECPTYALLGF